MGAIFEAIGNFFLSIFVKVSILILKLVRIILNLIFDISNINFFGDDIVSEITTRVYILIGVIMLFKITISCIQYLVSPDKAEDKENGFGGIIKRTIISVLLLAFVPALFDFAKDAQNAILEALPKVILGQERTSNVDDMADTMAYITALAFFDYTSDVCNNQTISRSFQDDSKALFSNIDDISKHSDKIAGEKCSNGEKRYTFKSHLCIPAGLVLVGILLSMVLDVGVRVVKFGFLQLIAPVPIASYIDPKTSKKSFDSWVHNCVTVYADLFIRLGVIYLVLYLFMILLPSFSKPFVLNNGTELPWGRTMLVNVAIIISLFMFAKSAPKFICDVLGIKDTGNLTDMFKRAGGLAGTGLGMGRDGYAGYKNKMNKLKHDNGGKNKFGDRGRALKSAITTAGSSGRAGMSSVLHNKGFKDTMSASKAAAARAYGLREMMKDKDVKAHQYYSEVMNRRLGIQSDFDVSNLEVEAAKSASDKSKAGLDYVHNNMSEKFSKVVFRDLNDVNKITDGKGINVTIYDSAGNAINLTGADLIAGNSRGLTIAGVEEMLKQIIANPNGKYSGQQIADAKGQLDVLQGYADKYIVNNANDSSVVPTNPAFLNILQDAMDAIATHSSDTKFGQKMIAKGKDDGILDSNGDVIKGHEGEWLALNKKEGQIAQTAAKKDMGGQMAGMVAKEIADKYDKKGS